VDTRSHGFKKQDVPKVVKNSEIPFNGDNPYSNSYSNETADFEKR